MIKVIIFDFDGTIIDSNRIKYEAFFRIFPRRKEIERIVKKVLNRYREETRFLIIKKILTELKKKGEINFNDLEREISIYVQKYNKIVEAEAIECHEIKGARESLKVLSERFILYINSTTPFYSLRRIIQKRSLTAFFKDIYGAPGSKIENLSKILKKEKIRGNEALIVGDGQSDLESAKKFGCKFIGIRSIFNVFTARDGKLLNDLRNLPGLIALMNQNAEQRFKKNI